MPFRAEISKAPKQAKLQGGPEGAGPGQGGVVIRNAIRRIRTGVVGLGYWGSRYVCVLRSTTGMAAVVGVDQRFAQIDDGQQQTNQGVAVYAGLTT